MKNFILKLFINSISVFLLATYVLGGVHVTSFGYAVLVAVILALLNASIRPILVVFTLPVSIVTLGFFVLVINTFIIEIAAYLVPNDGFKVDGWWWAFFFSILLSFLNSILEKLVTPATRTEPVDNGMKIFDKDGNRIA
jgi:putative membrane protein